MTWTSRHAAFFSAYMDVLRELGIKSVILRSFEGLPETNTAKDIDLLVPQDRYIEAAKRLETLASRSGFSRQLVSNYNRISCRTLLSIAGGVPFSVKFDLLLEPYLWKGALVLSSGEILAKSRSLGNFYVKDPVQDGVMLWLKPLLTGRFVKTKYVPRITECARKYPQAFENMLLEILGERLTEQLFPLVVSGRVEETARCWKEVRRTVWRRTFLRYPARTFYEALRHVCIELKRWFWLDRRNSAHWIAVLGPDGSGKSTVIEVLSQQVADLLVKDPEEVFVFHHRPAVFPNIRRLLAFCSKIEKEEDFSSPHRAAPASTLGSLCRILYYWLDYVLGYWVIVRPRLIRGKIILFDRYFHDFLVDPKRSRISLPEWVRKTLFRLTPLPTLSVVLEASPETVYSHKQEIPVNEIERQIKEYRDMAQEAKNLFVVDAEKEPAAIAREILKTYVERCLPRL